MTVYVPEEFTDAELDILRRYFSNLDQPVFALVNLPEVVKVPYLLVTAEVRAAFVVCFLMSSLTI